MKYIRKETKDIVEVTTTKAGYILTHKDGNRTHISKAKFDSRYELIEPDAGK